MHSRAKTLSLRHALLFAVGLSGGSLPAFGEWSSHTLIEAEYVSNEDFTGVKQSDVALATLEVQLDGSTNAGMAGHLVFLYEDDPTAVTNDVMAIDEAYLSLVLSEQHPMRVDVGRLYVPFGRFNTALISDPLTLDLGETREDVIQITMTDRAWGWIVYGFNGDSQLVVGDDTASDWGTELSYVSHSGGTVLDMAFGYIDSFADSDTLQGTIATIGGMQKRPAGRSFSFRMASGSLQLIYETVAASDTFDVADLVYSGQGAKPSATNLELAMLFGTSQLAFAQQSTEQAWALGLPKSRDAVVYGVALSEATEFKMEYATENDYAVAAGGSGRSARSLTLQLATRF